MLETCLDGQSMSDFATYKEEEESELMRPQSEPIFRCWEGEGESIGAMV